ncbi:MAG: bleomycin resistance family protein [Cyanobacteria bacterium J06639_1]
MMSTPSSSQKTPCKFDSLTPILNVENLRASIDYYVNVLGFKQDWDWGEPPTFASVSRDSVCIFLCEDGQGQSGTWMSVFVDDVDALFAEYEMKGAIVRQAPTNFAWGTREMNVEDLDGHRLRMSSSSNNASSDDVPLCE